MKSSGMTKAKKAIVRFVEIGGTVSECGQVVLGPSGVPLKQMLRGPYYTVNVHLPESGNRHPINVHQIVAYIKYGQEFVESELVRHKDGDPKNNSRDNILIGSQSQNMMDRSKLNRSLHAQHAASFKPTSVSDELLAKIKADHDLGLGYKRLSQKYGFGKSFFSYHLSKTAKRTKFRAVTPLSSGDCRETCGGAPVRGVDP